MACYISLKAGSPGCSFPVRILCVVVQGSANLYLYEVADILVASEVVTDTGMQVSVMDALQVIKVADLS